MVSQLVVIVAVLLSVACSGTSQTVPVQTKQAASARTIHPASGSEECIEMYGTCTPPPDPLCTSNALVLQCGESAELPSSGERLTCACP